MPEGKAKRGSLSALAKNMRVAIRQLGKAPGFSLAIVLTLALGIGSVTAIFSLVEGILLRPLPYKDASRLVFVGDHLGNNPGISMTAQEIETYRNATEAFSSMGAFITTDYEVTGGAEPEEVSAARMNASVFMTLGVSPALGRVFSAQEEDGHLPLAVISYELWLNRYHRDGGVLGSTIELDRKAYTIIGVMPRGFEFPLQPGRLNQAHLWVPLSLTADELAEANNGFWGYRMIARIKNGVTPAQAAKDAYRVSQQIMRNFPANMSAIKIRGDVNLVREAAVGDARPLLRTLFFAVAIVLLIACVNVSGMMLVRAIRKRRDYAVRLALGASSNAIIGESILEGAVLSVAGGLLGLGFAAVAVRTALRLLPESMPRIDSIHVDPTVAAFALLLALATGALCSIVPAFAALQTNLTESLKEGTRTGTGTASHAWLRSALVVSEIGIALVLLTVSGALLRSFQKMRAVDPGYRPDHVLVAGYQLPLRYYPTYTSADTFNKEVVERLKNKPGVEEVGIASTVPAANFFARGAYTLEGTPKESWKLKFAAFDLTYGDFFRAMGIRLLAGRTFTEQDGLDAPPVVIVNEAMAKNCWPGQEALGKRMHVGNPERKLPWATVIGVVSDTKQGALDEPDTDQFYLPMEQPGTVFGPQGSGTLVLPAGGYITVRTALPPEQMKGTLRATVAEIDPLLALQQVETMDEAVSNVEAPRRFNTDLITAFALGGLLLAITGIYAVVAFSVSVRTQELAIRVALGAQRGGIARLVLSSGAKLALIGCGLGVLASIGVAGLIKSFLFEVSATDPVIYLAAALLMMVTALLASAIPAARAAAADPIVALRSM
jgi:predicted permease